MEGVVRDTLTGSGHGRRAAWAVFDAAWYRKTYGIAEDGQGALEYYLTEGFKLGHSPNIYFCEEWYAAANPVVQQALTEGRIRSGFEHYCTSGRHERAGHWLFDPGYYREKNPDLTDEALERLGFANLYDHYLEVGSRENRIAHALFSTTLYRENFIDRSGFRIGEDECPFLHYLTQIENDNTEIPTSTYFDNDWYILQYPEVESEILNKKFSCALHHYLANSTPTEFNPLEYFREKFYLERYPELDKDVGLGKWFRSGYLHFIRFGQFEFRNPTPYINLQYYWTRRSNVMVDAQLANIQEPFAHLLTIGVLKGLPFAPMGNPVDVPERQSRALFLAHADNMMPQRARHPLDFRFEGDPQISVIMIIHNHLPMTLAALTTLRATYHGRIQVILVDSGSTDEARFIDRHVQGGLHLRFETNIGFVNACNSGLLHVRAPYLLFLNNDIQLTPGALDAAVSRLESEDDIGAVGAKVIRTNEKLQEAGCIVWRDGRTTGYMRDWSPLCPEANFVRDVDFCSGVFLLTKTDVVRRIGGFDVRFAPAYFEDADLCLEIWNAGYRVVYDPSVAVYHYEYGSSRESGAAFAMMHRNQKTFYTKHFQQLKRHFKDLPDIVSMARFAGKSRPRVLFIEDFVPLRGLGAGAVRSNDLIRVMDEIGYQVTVYPMHGTTATPAEIYADFPERVEVMHDVTHYNIGKFLSDRRDYFDCVWICRAHNLNLLKTALEQANFDPKKTTTVLDTEAIFSIREAVQAKRAGRHLDLKEAMSREFEHAHLCQEIVTVSATEAAVLHRFGFPHARVVGTYRPVKLTERSWQEREGILFVGSLYGDDTPNYDSLCWFIDQVMPLIEAELGWETRLNIVGHCAPGVPIDRFTSHSRVTWHGPVVELEKVYDMNRLLIAPTRFAAGTPYKVYEAASYGIPTVITNLLANQLGWKSGQHVIAVPVDDAEEFARQVVRVYRSPELWNSLREEAAALLRRDYGKETYVRALSHVLPATAARGEENPVRRPHGFPGTNQIVPASPPSLS
ncbi:glycosyltransferase [Labrys okinawensis]|uniref:glycosyltransferase n=1 Tax=Labrys okinawensis TaxID=346911 RepID=UPI0039BC86DB